MKRVAKDFAGELTETRFSTLFVFVVVLLMQVVNDYLVPNTATEFIAVAVLSLVVGVGIRSAEGFLTEWSQRK